MRQIDPKKWFSFVAVSVLGLVLCISPAAHAQSGVSEAEPNNSCVAPQDVTAAGLPFTLTASLGGSDLDFYRFHGTPGAFVIVNLQGASSGVGTLSDPLLGVFYSDCYNMAGINDDGGEGTESRLAFTVPDDGVFIVAATGYPDYQFTGQTTETGSYFLKVEERAAAESISAVVVDATTGSPMAGVSVVLRHCVNGSCDDFVANTVSDLEGEVRFQSGFFYTLTGDYQLSLSAYNYQTSEVDVHVAEAQQVDLGTVLLQPVPRVGSINGRVVDEHTRAPLSGTADPFARVDLFNCRQGPPCYAIRSTYTDAEGRFRFEGSSLNPLLTGTYQVRFRADQYYPNEVEPFFVGNGQNLDVGDVGLKSFPVRVRITQPCGAIPSTGGSCGYTVRFSNGLPSRFDGEVWTVVQGYDTGTSAGATTFQTENPRPINLRAGESLDMPFTFTVPGLVNDGAYICVQGFAARRPNPFNTLGQDILFCLVKGEGGFTQVAGPDKHDAAKASRGEKP